MKRNIYEVAGGWEDIPPAYIPQLRDFQELFKIAKERNDLLSALDLMFRYGFQLGRRCERASRKRAEKAAEA